MADKYVSVNVAPGAFNTESHKIHVTVDRKPTKTNDTIIQYSYVNPSIGKVGLMEASAIRVFWTYNLSKTLPYFISTASIEYEPLQIVSSFDHKAPCSNGARIFEFKVDGIKCAFHNDGIWRFRLWTTDYSLAGKIMVRLFKEIHDQTLKDFPLQPEKPFQITVSQTYNQHGSYVWTRGKTTNGRSMDSLYLEDTLKNNLEQVIIQFLDNRDLYERFGRRWKHVCLLYGPPGTGKSSIIRALGTRFKMNLYELIVNEKMSGIDMAMLVGQIPEKSILMMEDIDCLFDGREKTDGHAMTVSTILNTLDGVSTPEGLMIILTTNRLARLDPAMVRPGRIDFKAEIGLPHIGMLRKYLADVCPDFAKEHDAVIQHIIDNVKECTIAALQKYVFDCFAMKRKSLLLNLDELV